MRRDVYIENDSGGFSVLAADAVDAIIEDGRSDDFKFVKDYKALLLELYGDDSMPVRVVVDEPLRPDEEEQWLARVTWQLETTDGKMLVMGGFDPDVLSWWKEGSSANHADGRGVGAVMASPGKWKVDVYAHVGSMNGRVILDEESDTKPGAAFRRSHPDRPFPLWLAHMLDFSGEDDPGHEELWRDIKGSYTSGKLKVDAEGPHAIGFLVHFTRATTPPGEPPGEVWFGRSDNSRIPKVFPVGLASEVPDPNLTSLTNKLLDRKPPEEVRPIATETVEIIEVWTGDLLAPVEGGTVAIAPNEVHLLYWMAGLTSDSPPRFELWVEPKGAWTPPEATADFAVVRKHATIAMGPIPNTGGWHTWWTARDVSKAMVGIPDGSTMDFATARRDDPHMEPRDPALGRMMFSGKVSGGKWQIAEASPKISRDELEKAIAFVRDMTANGQIRAQSAAEKDVLNAEAVKNFLKEGDWIWEGDILRLKEPEERYLIMLAEPIFRERFKNHWMMAVEEELDHEDDE